MRYSDIDITGIVDFRVGEEPDFADEAVGRLGFVTEILLPAYKLVTDIVVSGADVALIPSAHYQ